MVCNYCGYYSHANNIDCPACGTTYVDNDVLKFKFKFLHPDGTLLANEFTQLLDNIGNQIRDFFENRCKECSVVEMTLMSRLLENEVDRTCLFASLGPEHRYESFCEKNVGTKTQNDNSDEADQG